MANKYQTRRRALKESGGRGQTGRGLRQEGRGQPAGERAYAFPPIDRKGLTAALSFGLVVLIAVLYVQTARHEFTVCDDNVYIYEKPQIRTGLTWESVKWAFSDAHEGNWHPLTWMTHMLDWQLFSHGSWEEQNKIYADSWAGGHHLVNMGIHCANAVLLFLALRLMTGTLWPSFVVAVLFAAHPLRVESVAWAAERKDVLCGLFWMSALLSYALYARRRPMRGTSYAAGVGIAFMLGIALFRLIVWPDLSDNTPTLLLALAGAVTVGIMLFAAFSLGASWTAQFAEIGSYSLITFFFGVGLTAKSMIVTLPCVFLLLDIWPLGRWRRALWPPERSADEGPDFARGLWLFVEKIPWFALAYFDCRITVVGQEKGVALNSFEGLPLWIRIMNGVESCGEYLRQMIWPTGLAPFYAHPYMVPPWTSDHHFTTEFLAKTAIYTLLLTAITIAAAIFFVRRTYLAVGWFWFLGALVPVIGIIQVGTQARADRYTYLPMIGVYLMIVWLVKEVADRWPRRRPLLAAGAAVLLAALAATTFVQASYWINSYKLFYHSVGAADADEDVKTEHAVLHVPHAGGDRQYFGYRSAGKVDLEKTKAVAETTNNYFGFNHIGIAFDKDGKEASKSDPVLAQILFDHSAAAFAATLAIKPDYDFGNNNLGVYFARGGKSHDPVRAEYFFKRAIEVNKRYADAFNNLGIVLAEQGRDLERQGRFDEALAKLEESAQQHTNGLGVRPDRASDHNNLCGAYLEMGKVHKAAAEKARQEHNTAKADDEGKLADLSLDQAMKEDDVALQCDPNFVGAWQSRIAILREQKKPDDTWHSYERIIEIDPTHDGVQALIALVAHYDEQKKPETVAQYLEMAGKFFLERVEGKTPSKEFVSMPYYLANAYLLTLKQPDNAIAWLDRTVKLVDATLAGQPEGLSLRLRLAVLYLKLKRPDQAEKVVAWVNQLLASNGSWIDAYALRQAAYQILGDTAAARADADRVAKAKPPERYSAARLFYDVDQPDNTVALLSPMILAGNLSSADAAALLMLRGAAYEMKGDFAPAKADYEHVKQIVPQYSGLQERLKSVDEKLKTPSK